MKVEIEEALCCGAGQCVMEAPEVFDQDDDGIVILLDESPDESQREVVEAAVAVCPTVAIRLHELAARA